MKYLHNIRQQFFLNQNRSFEMLDSKTKTRQKRFQQTYVLKSSELRLELRVQSCGFTKFKRPSQTGCDL